MRVGIIGSAVLGAVVLFAIGCGGGGGRRVITDTYVSNVPEAVPANTCIAVEGPFNVPASTMAFTVVDTPTGIGSDNMEVGVISDAIFLSQGCAFGLAVVDDPTVGSVSDSGPVAAGSYDFIVGCSNIVDDCLFNLTWYVTY